MQRLLRQPSKEESSNDLSEKRKKEIKLTKLKRIWTATLLSNKIKRMQVTPRVERKLRRRTMRLNTRYFIIQRISRRPF